MLINFNKLKYSLDHDFVDADDYEDSVINEWSMDGIEIKKYYKTYYTVVCKKCDILIRHEEGFSNVKLPMLYNVFYVAADVILIDEDDPSKIDFKKVYTCTEMMIKNLLE